MSSREMKVQGFEEIERVLKRLPGEIAKSKVLIPALRKGAKITAAVVREGAPGKIKEDVVIKQSTARQKRRGLGHMIIAFKRRSIKVSRLIEFGTAPHVIRTKRAKVLADKETGQVFGVTVHHPGMTARPFVRPALDRTAETAIRVIGEEMGKRAVKAAAKLAGSFAKSGLAKRRRR